MKQDPQIDSGLTDTPANSDDVNYQEQSSLGQTLDDYRQRYGLSVDPFGADPYFPFFTGGQRRELLDQVIHLCQFGYGMPVVLGERGVGKTRIALALYESMGSDDACFISALPTLHSAALLGHIAQHFDIGTADADIDQLLAILREFGKSCGDNGLALVLIDDAHDLDDESLKVILSLMQIQEDERSGLQVVLFGDISLIARLNKSNSVQVPVSDFYIERFTLDETVDYLNFRMEMADYLGPEMFTEEQVEPWWRLAQGQLTQIHRSAREHLLETVLPPLSNRTRPFPVVHIIAIAVLGSAVLMTLLYRGDKSEQELSVVQRVPINLQQSARVEPASIAVTSSVEASSTAASRVPVLSPDVAESGTPPIDTADQTVEQTSVVSERVRTTAMSLPQTADEPAAAIKPPSAETPRSALTVQSAPEIKTGARLSADEEALLSWNAADYTLQVLGVSTEKAAKDFIASQLNQEDLLMFKTLRQGKDWFVVVAGRYPNVAAAKAGIGALPQEQAKRGPWPREINVIQQDIKKIRE